MKELTITSADILGNREDSTPKRRGNRNTRVPEILEVATRVFAAEGSAGFTQRRIATDAGIRLSTLQHYFGTREELLRSTIETRSRRSFELYRTLLKDRARTPESVLDAIVDNVFTALDGSDVSVGAFALQCWSLAEKEAFARDLVAEINAELQDIFATVVARVNPSLSTAECSLRGALILSHMLGLVIYARRAGHNASDPEDLRVATKVVWKALSKAS
ncbi:TetR/AcrR family transcriptional regulator [Cupriavidus sp. CV2]|uniref:TetR/AcrR family transcriptional regulator n=1 Tax=Cupriavidus ulmosensis TaxID=3065913 RepID=UPI00296AE94F|nr:TetR/AcrR family transcriptional regulator [Cupriavidus sp. CV2]MDW3682302.1 TetR/AcrR family transcriptional regulator [Cupriavidus sp. CV2]